VAVVTYILTKYLRRKYLFQNIAHEQTVLHFEAFYASWISLRKIYFLKYVGQDLCQNPDFAAIINVEGQLAKAEPIDPIPYRGALKLFDVPRSVLEQPQQQPAGQKAKPKRSSLEEDVAELKELAEVFEPERMIVCQRSGQGKGCVMTWAPRDRVTVHIPYSGDVPGVVREVRMEGLTQKVRVTTVINAPLLGRNIISEDKRWFDGGSLSPRVSVIKELGEHDE